MDGRLVGTIDSFLTANLTHGGRPYMTIENLVVDAAHRRQGVGAALINAVVTEARSVGCYKVQLLSNQARREAHRFYEKVGFLPSAQGYRMYFSEKRS
jgi:GNAT superfamily N-acetyltransferase